MLIGLDLDNTIVDCDGMFRLQAEKLLGRDLSQSTREEIRALVRRDHSDPCWTDIQAEVYGPGYAECQPCTGAVAAISAIARCARVTQVAIISHKTITDSAGKNYQLRDYAKGWIEQHLLNGHTPLASAHIYFASTIEEKRRMIVEKKCDVFLDDLTEIILPLQGAITHPILFSKNPAAHPMKDKLHICDWPGFASFICHD